ncbi:hypothetical protein ANCDUO_11851 [Ancylostoma duodenale]|uniref:DNA2/NAM7 helicase helicase domain-containing protein n=1 Tax=Ancylostoma duodenale TaxID=51022 RepID=A0A0C2CMU9_9BILA|nr:hypothetical protein ANCDUO_11851 [Ancylostoma duodenale]
MPEKQRAICRRFTSGRLRYEMYKLERSLQLTEQEKADFVLTEKKASETLSGMLLICDEASQLPEPVFMDDKPPTSGLSCLYRRDPPIGAICSTFETCKPDCLPCKECH